MRPVAVRSSQASKLCRAPCRTFHRNDMDVAKTGIASLDGQFFGTVKVGGRRRGWSVGLQVLAGGEIRDDFAKIRVPKPLYESPGHE